MAPVDNLWVPFYKKERNGNYDNGIYTIVYVY